MPNTVNTASSNNFYTILKRIDYVLFSLLIISFLIVSLALSAPINGSTLIIGNVKTISQSIQISLVAVFLFNLFNIIAGVVLVAKNYFGKKEAAMNSLAIRILVMGIIGIVLLLVLYQAIFIYSGYVGF